MMIDRCMHACVIEIFVMHMSSAMRQIEERYGTFCNIAISVLCSYLCYLTVACIVALKRNRNKI